MINLSNKIFFILLLFFPLSVLVGPSISLINIVITSAMYLYFFLKFKHYNFLLKDKTVRLLTFLYLYLVFNTIISLSIENSIYRNLGFIRFVLFFWKRAAKYF